MMVFGHIHECGGRAYRMAGCRTILVNAASCGHPLKKGLNPPMVVDIDVKTKTVMGVELASGADDEEPKIDLF
jgi:hypothetical protein